MTKGIFQLSSAKDLVLKARHDIARLRSDPTDSYAAFDFFVTVRHIPDWLYPKDSAKADALFAKYVELRVCRHLADGAKHFEVTDRRHKQVRGSWKGAVAWARRTWSSAGVSAGRPWGQDGLFIVLDPRDTDTRSLGTQIDALQLAERALEIVEQTVI